MSQEPKWKKAIKGLTDYSSLHFNQLEAIVRYYRLRDCISSDEYKLFDRDGLYCPYSVSKVLDKALHEIQRRSPNQYDNSVHPSRQQYKEYITSSEWEQKRLLVLKRDNYTCLRCYKIRHELSVHHLTYENFGNEFIRQLATVCIPCHRQIDCSRQQEE